MCRNITELRGLEPAATRIEIEAAAAQYIRKVTGITKPNPELAEELRQASLAVADITEGLLAGLPARRQPPKTVPPLRRPEVRARLGLPPELEADTPSAHGHDHPHEHPHRHAPA